MHRLKLTTTSSCIFSYYEKAEKYFTDEGANLNDLAKMRLIEDMAPLTASFSVVHHSVGAIDALKTVNSLSKNAREFKFQ